MKFINYLDKFKVFESKECNWYKVLQRRTPKHAAVRELSGQEVSSSRDRGASHWFGLINTHMGGPGLGQVPQERDPETCGRFIE